MPEPELTIDDRIGFAQAAVDAYNMAREGGSGPVSSEEEDLTDMLTDLRHYADSKGISFIQCNNRGKTHYR